MRNLPKKVRRELDAKAASEARRNKPKPTNADRIRAMSDEELTRVLNGDQYIDFCHKGMCLDDETCAICMLRWLQQPAPEEGEQNV